MCVHVNTLYFISKFSSLYLMIFATVTHQLKKLINNYFDNRLIVSVIF